MRLSIYFLSLFFFSLPIFAQFGTDNDCSPVIYSQPFAISGDVPVRASFRYASVAGTCTGTLINQQTSDQGLRQLFVTARHCIHEGDFGEGPLVNLENVIFYFNFQSPDNDIQHTPANQPLLVGNRAVSGGVNFPSSSRYVFNSPVDLISETNVLVSGFGADVALLEIVRPIPPHFNVAYAGWSPILPAGPNGAWAAPFHLVHHPSGDVKKYAQAPTIFTFDNPANKSCRTVTRVIDTVIRLFTGRKTSIERVCNAVDVPQYVAPLLTVGAIRGGSSGSAFFTDSQRIFATTTSALGECINISTTYGKFRNGFAIHAFREALNPNFDIGANLWGINGRTRVCKDELRLSGNYFRADQYQPTNRIEISSNQTMRMGRIDSDQDGLIESRAVTIDVNAEVDNNNPRNLSWIEERFLRIHSGADFTINAGSAIEFLPGMQVDAGARFETSIGPCSATSVSAAFQNDDIVVPPIPPDYDQVDKKDRERPLNLDIPVEKYEPKKPVRLVILSNESNKEAIVFQYAVPQKGIIIVYLVDLKEQTIMVPVEVKDHGMGVFKGKIALTDLKEKEYWLRYKSDNETDEQKLIIE